jgi:hypothetical protein
MPQDLIFWGILNYNNILIYRYLAIILPHLCLSDVALVGGGTFPQPGEISLGHNGVLFLDELPEFKRTVLEVMRQPLEDRVITISRAKSTVDYPASLMVDFYKSSLKSKRQPSYSEALRNAKLKMITEGKYAHPFFWSPLILIGK